MKLSTGDEATLGNYRKLSAVVFGEESPATRMLDAKIVEQGVDQLVIQEESQMIMLLHSLNQKK